MQRSKQSLTKLLVIIARVNIVLDITFAYPHSNNYRTPTLPQQSRKIPWLSRRTPPWTNQRATTHSTRTTDQIDQTMNNRFKNNLLNAGRCIVAATKRGFGQSINHHFAAVTIQEFDEVYKPDDGFYQKFGCEKQTLRT